MRKKVTINIQILPMVKLDHRYKVQIRYQQGNNTFTHDNGGQGLSLDDATHLAFTMRDRIRSDEE